MNADDGRPVEGLRDGRQLVSGTDEIARGEVQLNEEPLPLLLRLIRGRNLLGGQDPGLGGELDHALVLREDAREEEVRGRQSRVPAQRDLGDGGEPAEMEPRGGGGGGRVAGEEGGLGEVELDGDGLHPPAVPRGCGGVVLQEAHRRRVALERLGREGIHLQGA